MQSGTANALAVSTFVTGLLLFVNASRAIDEDMDHSACGPIALTLCARTAGREANLYGIYAVLPKLQDNSDYSLLDLQGAASNLGIKSIGVRAEIGTQLQYPAVLPILSGGNRRHFVAVLAYREEGLYLVDFPRMGIWVTESTLRGQLGWNGEALLVYGPSEPVNDPLPRPCDRWPWMLCGSMTASAVTYIVSRRLISHSATR